MTGRRAGRCPRPCRRAMPRRRRPRRRAATGRRRPSARRPWRCRGRGTCASPAGRSPRDWRRARVIIEIIGLTSGTTPEAAAAPWTGALCGPPTRRDAEHGAGVAGVDDAVVVEHPGHHAGRPTRARSAPRRRPASPRRRPRRSPRRGPRRPAGRRSTARPASCCGPITADLALGQLNRNRGP